MKTNSIKSMSETNIINFVMRNSDAILISFK